MGIMSIRKAAQKFLAPVVVVLVVGLTIGLFYIGLPSMGKTDPSYKGPSIKLNGITLKDSDFEKYLYQASQQAQQYAQYGMTVSDDQIQDMAVSLATKELAFQEQMKKAGDKIKVSGSEVDQFVKKRWPTVEELQAVMQQFGFTEKNEFNKFVAENLEKLKLVSYKGRQFKIKVDKAFVEKSLKQITVSHILIGLKDPSTNKDLRTDAQALQRAQEVYQKATGGGNFADLAKQYSDDPGSKEKGGSLGQMPFDQFESNMVKEFVAAATALKEGQISQPVKTQYGYHIIKLDSLSVPTGDDYKTKYKEAEDQLLVQLTQQNPKFEKWLTNIYKKADEKVEILDPGLRAYRFKQKQQWEEAASAYQKALKKGYYNTRLDTYLSLSEVYLKLNRAKDAIAILKKAPVEFRSGMDCQLALAKAYYADGQKSKALSITAKLGKTGSEDAATHQKLKEVYGEWKLSDKVAKEEKILADIQKKMEEATQKQAEQQQPQQSPAPSAK